MHAVPTGAPPVPPHPPSGAEGDWHVCVQFGGWQVPPQPSEAPQATPLQVGVQQLPALQVWPVGQPQVFPQPSLTPQCGQAGTQPPSGDVQPEPGWQVLPQPSDEPQRMPAQVGVQQVPALQTCVAGHWHVPLQPSGPPHVLPQVGVQLATHCPPVHFSLAAHTEQAPPPVPQAAVVLPGWQVVPEMQPLQVTHWPFTQVWLVLQTWQVEPLEPQARLLFAGSKQ